MDRLKVTNLDFGHYIDPIVWEVNNLQKHSMVVVNTVGRSVY